MAQGTQDGNFCSRKSFAGNLYKKAYRIIVYNNKKLDTTHMSTEILNSSDNK